MSKKILITSALPYVNNVPHLGNLIGAVLSADVFARFSKQMNYETLYICGSDEHGTATENAAIAENLTPAELCDKYYVKHKEIYDWFSIQFDIFGRSSAQNHKDLTQSLFKKVLENGFVVERIMNQPYSVKSQMFLADRFIEGTCPYCSYEKATGDQCDNCGKLLDPKDLINPVAKLDGSTPEFRDTEHLFLDLEKIQPVLKAWFDKQSLEGNWTSNSIQITKAWFKEGLRKRAISRDLKWGIPVPHPGYENKVFYVWFDAPIAYMSITQQLLGDGWTDWWQNKDVQLYQFMGKDNIPFHSIMFPASIIAASDNPKDFTKADYNLAYHLDVTEYLNYEGTKFSKSNRVGVFGDQAKDTGIPADVFRYTLLYYRPEKADTQFTWKGLQERLNNELIANFGNFINRTLSFTNRFFEGKTTKITEEHLEEQAQLFLGEFREKASVYIEFLKEVKLRDALMELMKLSSLCNQYFQSSEPWKSRNEDPKKAHIDLTLLVHAVKDLAILCEPYMPNTSKEIFSQLGIHPRSFSDVGVLSVEDHKINDAKVLFKKLENEEVEILREKFSGKQKEAENGSENGSDKLQAYDVQFTVGKIIDIKKHPKADKLFIEQVDLGDKTIQILSGLVDHYTTDTLLDKKIFVVSNLKPAKMRGEMSYGMLLAAENKEGTVEVIDAKEFEVGDTFSSQAKEQISFDEFLTLKLTLSDHLVSINGEPFIIKDKQVRTSQIKDGDVR